MLNQSVIMGSLTRDPELRSTGAGVSVCSFTVAVDRDFSQNGQRETDFIDCVAWRKIGEFVCRNFSKGAMIVVSGRLQVRSWTDKDGNKRRSAEIVADEVYFGEGRKGRDAAGEAAGQSGNPGGGEFAQIGEDDPGLPF